MLLRLGIVAGRARASKVTAQHQAEKRACLQPEAWAGHCPGWSTAQAHLERASHAPEMVHPAALPRVMLPLSTSPKPRPADTVPFTPPLGCCIPLPANPESHHRALIARTGGCLGLWSSEGDLLHFQRCFLVSKEVAAIAQDRSEQSTHTLV